MRCVKANGKANYLTHNTQPLLDCRWSLPLSMIMAGYCGNFLHGSITCRSLNW